jgi:hypothetical protein
MSDQIRLLSNHIESRNITRRLKVNINKLAYSNNYLFVNNSSMKQKSALHIGLGHGHDTILSLLNNDINTAVGVDPFIESDGNGDSDYSGLLQLRDEMNLTERLQVFRLSIQDYLKKNDKKFDLIIINDVLHHMFVTKKRLDKSSLFLEAVGFFSKLKNASHDSTVLVVSDRIRHGFRPMLITIGLSKSETDYSTKQSARQWTKAIEKSGWKLFHTVNYIPYPLKKYTFFFQNRIFKHIICDKYYLYFNS